MSQNTFDKDVQKLIRAAGMINGGLKDEAEFLKIIQNTDQGKSLIDSANQKLQAILDVLSHALEEKHFCGIRLFYREESAGKINDVINALNGISSNSYRTILNHLPQRVQDSKDLKLEVLEFKNATQDIRNAYSEYAKKEAEKKAEQEKIRLQKEAEKREQELKNQLDEYEDGVKEYNPSKNVIQVKKHSPVVHSMKAGKIGSIRLKTNSIVSHTAHDSNSLRNNISQRTQDDSSHNESFNDPRSNMIDNGRLSIFTNTSQDNLMSQTSSPEKEPPKPTAESVTQALNTTLKYLQNHYQLQVQEKFNTFGYTGQSDRLAKSYLTVIAQILVLEQLNLSGFEFKSEELQQRDKARERIAKTKEELNPIVKSFQDFYTTNIAKVDGNIISAKLTSGVIYPEKEVGVYSTVISFAQLQEEESKKAITRTSRTLANMNFTPIEGNTVSLDKLGQDIYSQTKQNHQIAI